MNFALFLLQAAARIRHKADTDPGYAVPLIDTSMRVSTDNERVIQKREALIRRKWEGPNNTADIGMLAMGVRKYDEPPDLGKITAWFRRTMPATAEAAANQDELQAMALKLYRQLTPADQARIVASTADNTPPAESNNGQSMTAPATTLEQVMNAGRITFDKSDYKLPPSLFSNTTAAMRVVKKADDGVGRIDLTKMFTHRAWA